MVGMACCRVRGAAAAVRGWDRDAGPWVPRMGLLLGLRGAGRDWGLETVLKILGCSVVQDLGEGKQTQHPNNGVEFLGPEIVPLR